MPLRKPPALAQSVTRHRASSSIESPLRRQTPTQPKPPPPSDANQCLCPRDDSRARRQPAPFLPRGSPSARVPTAPKSSAHDPGSPPPSADTQGSVNFLTIRKPLFPLPLPTPGPAYRRNSEPPSSDSQSASSTEPCRAIQPRATISAQRRLERVPLPAPARSPPAFAPSSH